MFDIKEESTKEALMECIKLGKDQNDEVMERKYSPDADILSVVLEAGLMTIVTARKEQELVGYWLNTVTKDFISSDLIGREAAIFVDKKYRGSSIFLKMLRLTEKLARDKGAVSNLLTFEEGHDNGFAPRLGYVPLERTYIKNLGDG